jgi:hypothetical protein
VDGPDAEAVDGGPDPAERITGVLRSVQRDGRVALFRLSLSPQANEAGAKEAIGRRAGLEDERPTARSDRWAAPTAVRFGFSGPAGFGTLFRHHADRGPVAPTPRCAATAPRRAVNAISDGMIKFDRTLPADDRFRA